MDERQGNSKSLLFFWLGHLFTLFLVFQRIYSASAGTLMQTSSGVMIRHLGIPNLQLVGTPNNQSGLSPADIFGLITNSLNRWRQASGQLIQFDYWQGQYQRNLDYNQQSSIFFTSQTGGSLRLGSSVLAVTQVWYYVDSGQIIETDIALNDNDFIFTSNPADSTLLTGRAVYLGNVLTHELGHALGLSHSANIQSSMLFLEAPQQSKLSCDDIQTIHTAYGIRSGSLAEIRGRILSPTGSPLVGVQVSAISINRGTVLGSALSNKSGNFLIGSLEPGEYRIVAEPYYAGASPLPEYYDSVAGTICSGGRFFSRTFKNQTIHLTAGSSFHSGDFFVQCALSGEGAVIPSLEGGTTISNAIPLGTFLLDSVSKSSTTRKFYSLGVLQGSHRFSAIQYGLYSPIRTSLRLIDSQGRVVDPSVARSVQPSFIGNSGLRNADAYLETTQDLPRDEYFLEVTSELNRTDIYPAQFLALDSTGFYALTRSSIPSSEWSSEVFAKNSRCEATDPFDTYQSPTRPPRSQAERLRGTEPSSKFCASVTDKNRSSGPTPPGAILSWFLPFLIISFSHFLRKWRLRLN